MSSKNDNPTNSADEQRSSDHSNRLAGENSPYLLQHANNPVDWYPWGEEAIARAKEENKPIFLSIGYSACHWCHVMERESFEDPKIAAILNEGFIAIKVDREERPDLDEIYMTAVQLMTGAGGWPLSVFLTPDLRPFFGGTYFPPEDQYGRPGFANVLSRVAEVWEEKQDDILRSAKEITAVIHKNFETVASPSDTLVATVLSRAVEDLTHEFDSKWGGFGPAPKFPSSGAVAVLFRQYLHTGDTQLLDMATLTLDRMAYGGMYDQIGGGFHRYSTDDRWLVPHFEKMLYDNALISNVYLEAWQVTHKEHYKRVAEETLDYVIRDMKDPHGGFHSSEDADSEGKEGKFYVWLPDEVKAELGDKDGTLFCDYYDVSSAGNFEGHSILNVPRVPEEFAQDKSITPEELESLLAGLRVRLREARDKRVRPGKDDKVLAAWNGMMISAFARGYQILGHERFLHAAEGAADFVMTNMVSDGLLLRSYRGRDGSGEKGVSKLPGYLDDYAEMANGLIDLYEATFDPKWLEAADKLMTKMVADFYDKEHGGFFYTSASHKNLLVRTKPYYDGAVPSGNATATFVLLRLWKLLDNGGYYQKAKEILTVMGKTMLERPRGYLNLLCATDFYLHPTREIAVAGTLESADTREFLRFIHDRYIPNKILALVQPDAAASKKLEERVPLLAGKAMISGKAAVYVCEDFACKKPATDTEELGKLLENSR